MAITQETSETIATELMQCFDHGGPKELRERVDKIDPTLLEAALNRVKELGRQEFRQGNFRAALNYFDQALSVSEKLDDKKLLLSNKSLCYLHLQEFRLAANSARECILVDSTWGKGWFRLARALEMEHEYEKAFNCFIVAFKKVEPNFQIPAEGISLDLLHALPKAQSPEGSEIQSAIARVAPLAKKSRVLKRHEINYEKFAKIIEDDEVAEVNNEAEELPDIEFANHVKDDQKQRLVKMLQGKLEEQPEPPRQYKDFDLDITSLFTRQQLPFGSAQGGKLSQLEKIKTIFLHYLKFQKECLLDLKARRSDYDACFIESFRNHLATVTSTQRVAVLMLGATSPTAIVDVLRILRQGRWEHWSLTISTGFADHVAASIVAKLLIANGLQVGRSRLQIVSCGDHENLQFETDDNVNNEIQQSIKKPNFVLIDQELLVPSAWGLCRLAATLLELDKKIGLCSCKIFPSRVQLVVALANVQNSPRLPQWNWTPLQEAIGWSIQPEEIPASASYSQILDHAVVGELDLSNPRILSLKDVHLLNTTTEGSNAVMLAITVEDECCCHCLDSRLFQWLQRSLLPGSSTVAEWIIRGKMRHLVFQFSLPRPWKVRYSLDREFLSSMKGMTGAWASAWARFLKHTAEDAINRARADFVPRVEEVVLGSTKRRTMMPHDYMIVCCGFGCGALPLTLLHSLVSLSPTEFARFEMCLLESSSGAASNFKRLIEEAKNLDLLHSAYEKQRSNNVQDAQWTTGKGIPVVMQHQLEDVDKSKRLGAFLRQIEGYLFGNSTGIPVVKVHSRDIRQLAPPKECCDMMTYLEWCHFAGIQPQPGMQAIPEALVLHLPKKANLFILGDGISNDPSGLREGLIPIVQYLRSNIMEPHGIIRPGALRLMGRLVQFCTPFIEDDAIDVSDLLCLRNPVALSPQQLSEYQACPSQLSIFDKCEIAQWKEKLSFDDHFQSRSDPFAIFDVRFATKEESGSLLSLANKTLSLKIPIKGTKSSASRINGVVYWTEWEIVPGYWVTNAPEGWNNDRNEPMIYHEGAGNICYQVLEDRNVEEWELVNLTFRVDARGTNYCMVIDDDLVERRTKVPVLNPHLAEKMWESLRLSSRVAQELLNNPKLSKLVKIGATELAAQLQLTPSRVDPVIANKLVFGCFS